MQEHKLKIIKIIDEAIDTKTFRLKTPKQIKFLPGQFFMVRFEEADARLFKNVWICMRCNAKNRSLSRKPAKCRKCGSPRLRLKHKAKKSGK